MKYLLLQNFYGAVAIPLSSAHLLSGIMFGNTEGYGAEMRFTPQTESMSFILTELKAPDDVVGNAGVIPF